MDEHTGEFADPAEPLADAPAVAAEELPGGVYVLKDGDTWESIAKRELGNVALAPGLIAFNPDSRLVEPGSKIRLPLDADDMRAIRHAAGLIEAEAEDG